MDQVLINQKSLTEADQSTIVRGGLAIMHNYYMVNHQTVNAYGESNNLSELADRSLLLGSWDAYVLPCSAHRLSLL
jgi:hypothetical protein